MLSLHEKSPHALAVGFVDRNYHGTQRMYTSQAIQDTDIVGEFANPVLVNTL